MSVLSGAPHIEPSAPHVSEVVGPAPTAAARSRADQRVVLLVGCIAVGAAFALVAMLALVAAAVAAFGFGPVRRLAAAGRRRQ